MKIKFSVPITSTEVCFATGAKYTGDKRTFTHLSTSSCDADENTLFFALQGKRTSGEEFVRGLERNNICSVSRQSGNCLFTHSSPLDALLNLAHYYKGKLPSLKKTVAITGSVGKTTTKEFLLRILSLKWKTHANEGNFNSEIGVPLTIFTTPTDCEMLILEFGMSHRGEIQRLSRCALPDLAIITNIGHAHIGNLGSREAIAEEKMSICAHNQKMPVLVDSHESLLEKLKGKITLYGDIEIQISEKETEFTYQENKYQLPLPALPYDTRSCLYFSIATAILLGLCSEEINKGLLTALHAPTRRKEISIGGLSLIDDTYNASPESMLSAISYLKETDANKRYMVLGDMLELGDYTVPLHKTLGGEIARASVDGVYLFGEYGAYTREGLIESGYNPESIHLFPDTKNYEGLICQLSNQLESGDVCLLKGSHGTGLWKITEGLEEVFG